MSPKFKKLFSAPVLLTLVAGGLLSAFVTSLAIYWLVVPKLPEIELLRDIQFQVPLKVYTKDEKLIAEYGEKKRAPLDIEQTPKELVNAVLAAEDDRFFEHPGVDIKGLLRAVVYLLRTGQKGQGGSTITMQVARNFFLSREKTYLRKLNEILLALKIEQEITKKEILELYLNKIYLGNRAYGFAAAAQVYYGKKLEELNVAQIAMIAGLPKAPSRYNPIVNPKRALQRRNYVLSRMKDLNTLSETDFQEAMEYLDDAEYHGLQVEVSAPYVAEMVRSELINRLGDDAYTQGFRVYTTIEGRLQTAANDALREALLAYEERHGFRPPEANVDISQIEENDEVAYRAILSDYRHRNGLWPALVLSVGDQDALVYQSRHGKILLKWEGIKWASPYVADGKDPGPAPQKATDVLKPGDIIRIAKMDQENWKLAQIPRVEGALVSLSAHDGAVLALVGGFDFNKSKFNRVTQAERQPGSNIKPFNYTAALEKGYTAASLVNDAPIVFEDPGLESTWRPENYSGRVFGPTRLRQALIKSRNLVSIRLLRAIGIPYAIDFLQQFGFRKESLPRDLSLSLGSAAITPMELVTGYAVFANGGYKVTPYFIDRVETAEGEVILRSNPLVVCEQCENPDPSQQAEGEMVTTEGAQSTENQAVAVADTASGTMTDALGQPGDALLVPVIQGAEDDSSFNNGAEFEQKLPIRVAKRVISPQSTYIMNSILRDVIKLGTGRRALSLGRGDIAGKTGTTNDQRDAWFSGFSPDVVTTAWVGFDSPHPLGNRETGGKAALPMWIKYMEEALKGLPEVAQETPPGLVSVRIDPETGLLVGAGFPDAQFEIFHADRVPRRLDEEPSATMDPGLGGVVDPGEVGTQSEESEQLF